MVSTAPTPAKPAKPARTPEERRRRRRILGAVLAVVLFAVALAIWAGPDIGESDPPSTSAGSRPPLATSIPSLEPSSKAPGASASTGLPGLPGISGIAGSGITLPDATNLNSLGPGNHRVVVTARSTSPMLAVAYSVKGTQTGKVVYNVQSPVTIARTISGGRPYAAIALQIAPTGAASSCEVSIDGKVVNTRSSSSPYAVIACVG